MYQKAAQLDNLSCRLGAELGPKRETNTNAFYTTGRRARVNGDEVANAEWSAMSMGRTKITELFETTV